MCEMLGMTEMEIIEAGREGLAVNDSRLASALEERTRTGKFLGELTFRRKDGSHLPVELSSRLFKDHNGMVKTSMVVRDVTERKQAEDAMKPARDELELRVAERTRAARQQAELLNLAHDAILVRDLAGRISFWSSGAQAIYGFTGEEAVGNTTHTILRTKFPAPESDIIATVSQAGRWEGELTHTCKEGKPIVVLSRWAARRSEKGKLLEILEVNTNITDRKRAEREVLDKAQALEELNTALKVLLDHHKNDQKEFEKTITANMKNRVAPYVEKLRHTPLDTGQAALVEIIERGIQEIASPFLKNITSRYAHFTRREIEIIDLIKDGKTTKEIADTLHMGKRTVDSHRDNIRKKFEVTDKKVNLRSYLISNFNTVI